MFGSTHLQALDQFSVNTLYEAGTLVNQSRIDLHQRRTRLNSAIGFYTRIDSAHADEHRLAEQFLGDGVEYGETLFLYNRAAESAEIFRMCCE